MDNIKNILQYMKDNEDIQELLEGLIKSLNHRLVNKLYDEIETLKDERDTADSVAEELKQENEDLTEKVEELEEENETLSQELENIKEELEEIEDLATSIANKIDWIR